MSSLTDVAITGGGCVTPWGVGLAAALEGYRQRRCALSATSAPYPAFGVTHAGLWPEMDPRAAFRVTKPLKVAHTTARAAVMAAREALGETSTEGRGGVALAMSGGDLQVDQVATALRDFGDQADVLDIARFGQEVMQHLPPLWLLMALPNLVSAHVAIQVEADGPNVALMGEGAAGLMAIAEAARWVGRGEAAWALGGASDMGVLPLAALAAQSHPVARGLVPGNAAVVVRLARRTESDRVLGTIGDAFDAVVDGPSDAGDWVAHLPIDVGAPWRIALAIEDPAVRAVVQAVLRDRCREVSFIEPMELVGHAPAALGALGLLLALGEAPAGHVLAIGIGSSGAAGALTVTGSAEGWNR